MGCIHKGLPFCDQKGSEKVSLLRGSEPRPRGPAPLEPQRRGRPTEKLKNAGVLHFSQRFWALLHIDPSGANSSAIFCRGRCSSSARKLTLKFICRGGVLDAPRVWVAVRLCFGSHSCRLVGRGLDPSLQPSNLTNRNFFISCSEKM